MATLKTYALTSLADVKESLKLPSSNNTYNNLIIRKINAATAMIENYCGRRFKATDYTRELYNGSGTNQLVLRQRPIIGDITLEARDSGLNEANYETLDSELIYADASSGVLDLLFTSSPLWGRFAVTYRAGYEDIPDDLAEACASLAAYLVNNADSGSVNIKAKQEGQRKVDYSQQGLGGTVNLFKQLGIDDVLAVYANNALFADK